MFDEEDVHGGSHCSDFLSDLYIKVLTPTMSIQWHSGPGGVSFESTLMGKMEISSNSLSSQCYSSIVALLFDPTDYKINVITFL